MNSYLAAFSTVILGSFALVSCEFSDSSSGGTHLKNPTVEQMADMERQWGVQPSTNRSRLMPNVGDGAAPDPAINPDPSQNFAPPTAPLPQPPATAPPIFEPPPGATPDQIQRLRN